LGFAPKNEEIYKSDGDRKAARSVHYKNCFYKQWKLFNYIHYGTERI
jgi:hypothetical protein